MSGSEGASTAAPGRLLYLDSSALVKLVLPAPETGALLELLRAWPHRVSSEIAAVEVARAARRASEDPEVHQRADQVLSGVHLLRLDRAILAHAGRLAPTTLRSLDALHLASAVALGRDLGAFVAYDRRLAEAARPLPGEVLVPGQI